jgi:hypothetical protein
MPNKGTLVLVVILSLAALALTLLAPGFLLDNGLVYGAF